MKCGFCNHPGLHAEWLAPGATVVRCKNCRECRELDEADRKAADQSDPDGSRS